jgi:predicted carbohydrate-binding protein with CBM5 and CBM33 domain
MTSALPRTGRRKRRNAVLVLLATVPALWWSVFSGGPASAHGAPMTPGSRTFLCWQEGLTQSGEIKPNNPACAAALASGGQNAFYNWFGVLRSDGAGRTRGFIPDGKLCSGNNPTFAGFDLPRSDWPATHLTAGATYQFTYNMWAAHPGFFYTYVTKDGYDPTKPLTWDDLESTPFYTADHPPSSGQVATLNGKYYWNATLPANKSGRHIIYTVWSRTDSTETFYSCSDVVFDGGHGEVTGVGPGQTSSPPPVSSSSPPPVSSSSPPPVSSSSPPPVSSSSPPPVSSSSPPPANGLACSVSYKTVSSWSSGYQGEVTVTNTGSVPLHGWMVHFSLPSGQKVTQAWNATTAADGAGYIASNVSWNASVAPNASTSWGYLGSTGTQPSASAFSCMPM